jgi:hypothetical protein
MRIPHITVTDLTETVLSGDIHPAGSPSRNKKSRQDALTLEGILLRPSSTTMRGKISSASGRISNFT